MTIARPGVYTAQPESSVNSAMMEIMVRICVALCLGNRRMSLYEGSTGNLESGLRADGITN